MDPLNPILALPVLIFFAVVGVGGALVLGRSRARSIQARLHAGTPRGDLDGEDDLGDEPRHDLLRVVGTAVAPRGPSAQLRANLAAAGFYGKQTAYIFLGVKVITFTCGLMLMIFLLSWMPPWVGVPLKVLLVLIGAMTGMILPNAVLAARRARRQAEVRAFLPDAVDLLEICVSAGMGLDMAWRAVTEQVRRVSAVLADEMSLTDMEINLGGGRALAMRHMAQRTGADELHWLVTAFVQSDRFGTSLSDTLRSFAESMREDRTRRAEESAEKMAVRILLPLVVFIFPTIILVCVGPAGIKIAAAFSGD